MPAQHNDLVIDVGNTRTKAALFAQGRLLRWGAWNNEDGNGCLRFLDGIVPQRAAVVNVADLTLDPLARLDANVPVLRITGVHPSPLHMAYATPQTLGADRLVNAVAAWALFPGRAALAIDLGTCITYDLVEQNGTYRGGAISPGAAMRARAMNAFSAQLPLVDIDGPVDLPGIRTDHALRAGIHHGIRGELLELIGTFRHQYADLAVVLTGGDGLRFARALESGIFADPLLTLRGTLVLLDHTDPVAGRLRPG